MSEASSSMSIESSADSVLTTISATISSSSGRRPEAWRWALVRSDRWETGFLGAVRLPRREDVVKAGFLCADPGRDDDEAGDAGGAPL